MKRMTVIFHVKTSQKLGMNALVMLSCVLFYSALHGGGDQGCQNAYKSGLPFAAIFFDFIYINWNVIGTCMQNFKKIDRKKKLSFFQLKI